ncbi:MAG: hypothetical protein CVU77_03790 [Elusimicrobia bacterium HGW-Elusimicrobia-1]|jgi:biotin carboxyl carrier protein|nr:MAG: hypothetical protein CVU77_03790 [Elusimicrobia bacterium HGW-Elusimicrobia-1]
MTDADKLILEDGTYSTIVPSKKRPRSVRPDPLAISAPIPGVVAALLAKEGDVVEAGRPVLYLEAMKMENELSAAVPSRIEKICVKVGDRVKKNDILVRLSARDTKK